MKKRKSIVCAILLSTVLTGNAFAGSSSGGGEVFSFFGSIYNAVVSLMIGGGDCETRQCQTCKPADNGENNCRPTR